MLSATLNKPQANSLNSRHRIGRAIYDLAMTDCHKTRPSYERRLPFRFRLSSSALPLPWMTVALALTPRPLLSLYTFLVSIFPSYIYEPMLHNEHSYTVACLVWVIHDYCENKLHKNFFPFNAFDIVVTLEDEVCCPLLLERILCSDNAKKN